MIIKTSKWAIFCSHLNKSIINKNEEFIEFEIKKINSFN